MMPSFDEVIPTLVRICETREHFADLDKACVVRDLKGVVRLVIRPGPVKPMVDVEALQRELSRELGKYFAAPILSTSGPVERARLAKNMLDQAQPWPDNWPDEYSDPITGHTARLTPELWCSFQRFVAKEAWLSPQQVKPPWPLTDHAPAVVSFFSFKGGVGRTSLVGAMAWHLAREKKRVAVLDLDLEAPGIAVLLGADSPRGIVDFIVDHIATRSADIGDAFGAARALGDEDGARVDVFPAGRMNRDFLEKLARLDFAATGPGTEEVSPTAKALKALLKCIRTERQPDIILLDSRSGLHDLGGLSLHALAHVDVLVGRAGEQNYQGLDLTVHALERRKAEDEFRCIVVHAMAPLQADSAIGKEERRAFRDRSHRIFSGQVYSRLEDEPEVDDSSAQHFPWVIPHYQELERMTILDESLASIIFAESYAAVYQRIIELCAVEDDTNES